MSAQGPRPGVGRACSSESDLSGSSFLPIIHEDAEETSDQTSAFNPTVIPETGSVMPMGFEKTDESHGPKKGSSFLHASSRSFIVSHYQDGNENDVPSKHRQLHLEDSLKDAIDAPSRSPNTSEPETAIPARPRAPSLSGDTEPFPDLEAFNEEDQCDVCSAQEKAYSYAMAKVAEEIKRLNEIEANLAAIRGLVLTVESDDTQGATKPSYNIRPCLEASHHDHFCEDHEVNKIAVRKQISNFLFKKKDIPRAFRKRFLAVCNMIIEIEHIFFRSKHWPKDPISLITTEEIRTVRLYASEIIKYLSTLGGLIFRERDRAEQARCLVAEVAGSNLPPIELFKRMAGIVVQPQCFLTPVRLIERTFFDLFFSFYDVFLYDDFHVMYNNYLVDHIPNVSPRLRQASYLLNTIYSIIANTAQGYKDMCEINKDIGVRFIQPVLEQLAQATAPPTREHDLVAYPALAVELGGKTAAGADLLLLKAHEDTGIQAEPQTEIEAPASLNNFQSKRDGIQITLSKTSVSRWANRPFSSRRVGNAYMPADFYGNNTNTEGSNTGETSSLAVQYHEEVNDFPEDNQQDIHFPSSSFHTMAVDGPSLDPHVPYQGFSQVHDYDSDGGDTEVMRNSKFNRAWAQSRLDEAASERAYAEREYAERVAAQFSKTIGDKNNVEDVCSSRQSSAQSLHTMDHEASHIPRATSQTLDFEDDDAAVSSPFERTQTTVVDPLHANMIEDYFKNIQGPIYSSHTGVNDEQVSTNLTQNDPARDTTDTDFDFLDSNNQDDEDWLPHDWDYDDDRPTAPGYMSYAPNRRNENERDYVSVETFAARPEEMAQARMYQNIEMLHSRNRSRTSTVAQYNTPCFAASRTSSTGSKENQSGYSRFYLPVAENKNASANSTATNNSNEDNDRSGATSPLLPPLPAYPGYGRRISDIEAERERERERDRNRARRLASVSQSCPTIEYHTGRPVGITGSPGETIFSLDTEFDVGLDPLNAIDIAHARRLRELQSRIETEAESVPESENQLFPPYRLGLQRQEHLDHQRQVSRFRSGSRFGFLRLARAVMPTRIRTSPKSASSHGSQGNPFGVSYPHSQEDRSWGSERNW